MAGGRELTYHNLAVMLEAGVPVIKAVSTVAAGVRGRLAKDLRYLADAMRDGTSLSAAMRQRPRSFPAFDMLIVNAGETSGSLDDSLYRLSKAYAFRRQLQTTIFSGLAYPLFVLHAAAFLLPLPAVFLSGLGAVDYLLAVARVLASFYVPALIIWAVLRLSSKSGIARKVVDRLLLQVPLLGGGLLHLSLSRFCALFSALISAGVPITQALPQAAEACGSTAVAARLAGAVRSVKEGHPAWEGFSWRLPRQFTATWASGEESGKLDEMTAHLARTEGESAQWRLSELAKWFPRLVYFLIVIYLAMTIVASAVPLLTGL